MTVGRSHKWYYDQGVWQDKKITPDVWQINYAVTKRRAGRAPAGSGVPVGTAYHWYILAHQNVCKLDANDYTTSMTGLKFKVAHKRVDKNQWSATPKTQRKRMIKFLQSVIADLERQQDEEATKKEKPARKAAGKTAREAVGKPTPAAEPTGSKRVKRPRSRQPATPRSMTKPARRRVKRTA